ncbi:MAG TPA: hypothetical protein PLS56_01360 [Candidatus Dojkabacteria bacterium]|nr:hypothetical protein [Candidatus Dojkabacteria bacterium]
MDKYDKHIAELTAEPGKIPSHWVNGKDLFKFAENGVIITNMTYEGRRVESGCLTMIREDSSKYKAVIGGVVDEELTQQIANDDSLPSSSEEITVESLPLFAKWQRIFDQKIKENAEKSV